MKLPSLCLAALCSIFPGLLHAGHVSVPVSTRDRTGAALRFTPGSRTRVFVADLRSGTAGKVIQGTTERILRPGRYRLHVMLAINPVGHPYLQDIRLVLRAGGRSRRVTAFDFYKSDQFIDVSLDFSAPGG